MIRKKRMGKGIAKILSGLLVFGMVAGVVPAVPGGTVHAKAEGESEQNVTAAENPEHKHCVCGKGEHTNNGHDYKEETWTGISDLNRITGEGYYYLTQNVTIDSAWNCPYDVTLCLNGHSITREGNDEQNIYDVGGNAVIKINNSISFALTDCQETVGTITHKAGVSGEGVYNAGKFTMYNGKLSGNNGGVTNQRTFEMYGGTICQNTAEYGGGVYNKDTGTFNMYSGTITDNTASTGYYDGGGGVCNEGMFSMSGGHIFQNKSTNHGGGVNNGSGTFEMSGGEISKNTTTNRGGGVFNKGGTFIMSDAAKISENKAICGGGVYKESGTFTMSGGTITGNTAAGSAANASGGGVYNEAEAFTMSGGTITQNKSQDSGGGVYYKSGTFEMSGGAIADNETKVYGGGVYNNGAFTMSGGEITHNKSEKYGGGVQHASLESFKMSGTAKITNNTAISGGGGVLVEKGRAITLGGAVEITGNKVGDNRDNNLYLGRETTVQTDSLTGKETIGVTTYNSPTDDSSVTITSDATSAGCFFSDNSAYEIGTDAGAGVVLKCKEKLPTVPDPVPNRFTYDGAVHTGIELGENYTVARGTNSATDAGTYEVIIKPFSGKTWKDGTAEEKTFNWKITKASQNAPAGLVGEKPTTAGGSDGKITGVKENMEYRKSGTDSYIACTGTEITGLSAGTYEVRYKGDTNHEESPAFVVTVPDADKPVYILEIINGTGNGTYVEGTVVTITANPAADGKVFDKWVKMYGDAVIADENSATTTVTTKIAPTTIKATYKDSETTPTPNPEPTPNPNPEPTPTPTPTPNPTPEATTPTPDPAPATSTPAASTTTAPAASAPVQVMYDILDGAGSSWTQNTDGSLAIRGSGEISKFREVKVDGVTVDPVNYTVTEGSTIITFKPEYLKSLSAGNHSFELVWTDGTAATNFTVAENADQSAKSPKTGEDFSRALCTVLLMVSCAGLAGMFVRRKRNNVR